MIERLTYVEIAERLGISPEAARALVKRHHLPRARSNDGSKVLVGIDLADIQHRPLMRSPRGHEPAADPTAPLMARIAELEAELARAEECSRGHRADYERERDRADHLVIAHDRLVSQLQAMRSLELTALRSLVQAAENQQAAQPVTVQELATELDAFHRLLEAQLQPVQPVTTRTRFTWWPWRRAAG